MPNEEAMNAAIKLVNAYPKQISISLLQRHFRLGYSEGVSLMQSLISNGIVIDHETETIEDRYSLA